MSCSALKHIQIKMHIFGQHPPPPPFNLAPSILGGGYNNNYAYLFVKPNPRQLDNMSWIREVTLPCLQINHPGILQRIKTEQYSCFFLNYPPLHPIYKHIYSQVRTTSPFQ